MEESACPQCPSVHPLSDPAVVADDAIGLVDEEIVLSLHLGSELCHVGLPVAVVGDVADDAELYDIPSLGMGATRPFC